MSGRACGVCGAAVPPPFQAPPPELAPDLDLRPGEPTRSTLSRWVATCRACGFSAPDLAEGVAGARDAVRGEAYRALAGPGTARAALRYAFLAEQAGERAEAAGAVLQAAWARDDKEEDASALRLRAAALWGEGAVVQDGLRRVDALRRAGAMDEALAAIGAMEAGAPGETDQAVLLYQRGLVQGGDRGRHLLSSALRPPAQRPHVTHGRSAAAEKKPGLLGRLFGR